VKKKASEHLALTSIKRHWLEHLEGGRKKPQNLRRSSQPCGELNKRKENPGGGVVMKHSTLQENSAVCEGRYASP